MYGRRSNGEAGSVMVIKKTYDDDGVDVVKVICVGVEDGI